MMYEVTDKVKKLTEEFGYDAKQLVDRFDMTSWDGVYNVYNKGKLNGITNLVKEEERKAKEAAYHEKRMSSFRWTKEDGEWVVAGNFENIDEGDEIEVLRANGASSIETVIEFTEAGNARIK